MNSDGAPAFEEQVLTILEIIRMVSSKDMNSAATAIPPLLDLAEGNYTLVGWEVDTTGRRLIDEICQIGAYTPSAAYSQYIMPYGDLNPFAQRRYHLKVITVTRYRMLKDLKTNKILKTKSEVSALLDFIMWLEKNKGSNSDGIILVYHEVKKMVPLMLLGALKRYGLFNRFAAVVKGFCNTHPLAETKCATTIKSFSLKVLSRVLLHKEDEFGSAIDRAKACYNIVLHLGLKEHQKQDADLSGDSTASESCAAEFTRQYARSTESEEKDLIELKSFIDRQNTFRPVFKDLMKFDWVSRQNASRIRRKLVENNLDFYKLRTAWNTGGRKGLQDLLKTVSSASKREHSDLLTIFDCYFDPCKKPVSPNYYRQRRKRSSSQKKYSKQETVQEPEQETQETEQETLETEQETLETEQETLETEQETLETEQETPETQETEQDTEQEEETKEQDQEEEQENEDEKEREREQQRGQEKGQGEYKSSGDNSNISSARSEEQNSINLE